MGLVGMHLSRLLDGSGRENRQPFWLWMLVVVAGQTIVGMVAGTAMMASMMPAMTTAGGASGAGGDAQQAEFLRVMLPMMRTWMLVSTLLAFVVMLLVGAAVVRRLHDGGRSGWWALPAFLGQGVTLVAFTAMVPRFFTTFFSAATAAQRDVGLNPDQVDARVMAAMQPFLWAQLLGMVAAVLVLVLAVMLTLPGTPGPNRYGEDPLGRRAGDRYGSA